MSDSVICGPPMRKFNLICLSQTLSIFYFIFKSIPTDSNKAAMLMVNTKDKNFFEEFTWKIALSSQET